MRDRIHWDYRAGRVGWALPLVCISMVVAASSQSMGEGMRGMDAPYFDPQPLLVIAAEELDFEVQRDRFIEVRRGRVRIRISEHDAIRVDETVEEGYIPTSEELQRFEIDDALIEIVDRLGDASFAVREAASRELDEHDVEPEQLYAVLDRFDLSLEQRMRILHVLRERLLHAPRGAIGIRMRPLAMNRDDSAIVVVGLIAGLPAENVLREDDRITHINGERIDSPDELTTKVQARRPGDRVRLRVQRPERDERGQIQRDEDGAAIIETLEVDLTLGSAERLVDPATGQRQPVRQVPQQRHREVSEAYGRYAGRTQEIQLTGELPDLSDDDAGTNGMDARVDEHTFIRHLREQLQWIDEGNMRQTRALREQWDIRRRVLEQQIKQPNLTDDEREYLRRVLRRFDELMER